MLPEKVYRKSLEEVTKVLLDHYEPKPFWLPTFRNGCPLNRMHSFSLPYVEQLFDSVTVITTFSATCIAVAPVIGTLNYKKLLPIEGQLSLFSKIAYLLLSTEKFSKGRKPGRPFFKQAKNLFQKISCGSLSVVSVLYWWTSRNR